MILWTGESEYCQCGHHIEHHKGVGSTWHTTGTNSVGVIPNPITGAFGQCAKCDKCKEFIPSKFAHQED
jgi:hypothetical protein